MIRIRAQDALTSLHEIGIFQIKNACENWKGRTVGLRVATSQKRIHEGVKKPALLPNPHNGPTPGHFINGNNPYRVRMMHILNSEFILISDRRRQSTFVKSVSKTTSLLRISSRISLIYVYNVFPTGVKQLHVICLRLFTPKFYFPTFYKPLFGVKFYLIVFKFLKITSSRSN